MTGIIRPNPELNLLVKDAGVILTNFKEIYDEIDDYDEFIDAYLEIMDTPNYLGITRGGNSSSLENEIRIVEYDGRRIRTIGDFVIDSTTPQIQTTLLVHSIENMQRVTPISDVFIVGGKKTLRPRGGGSPRQSDYIPSLSWVRETVDGSFKIVTLLNAINIGTSSQTGTDKSESEMPVTFIGTAKTWEDTEYAPIEEILWSREPILP